MKNKYYIIETDCNLECPEVKGLCTTKNEAWQQARTYQKTQAAYNSLYRRKRNNRYFVANSQSFLDTDISFIKKLDRKTIIFEA